MLVTSQGVGSSYSQPIILSRLFALNNVDCLLLHTIGLKVTSLIHWQSIICLPMNWRRNFKTYIIVVTFVLNYVKENLTLYVTKAETFLNTLRTRNMGRKLSNKPTPIVYSNTWRSPVISIIRDQIHLQYKFVGYEIMDAKSAKLRLFSSSKPHSLYYLS